MKSEWSSSWKSSKQPRKQRKFRHNAPKHIMNKFVSCHLSPELRKKYNTRSITLRKGDKVKIVRGQFRGKTGSVDRINLKKSRIYVTGIETIKKDGSKAFYPINPSNLMITEIKVDDRTRLKNKGSKK